MSSKWDADEVFALRSENVDRYQRNFLRQAVCELRFPTLLELGEAKPPAALVKALRKEYPHLDLTNELTIGLGGGSTGSNNAHVFRSLKQTWTVTFKQSSVAIETTSYTDYARMRKRVLEIVEVASKFIDTDFFTRIGMRYINIIDPGVDPADGWINPDLVRPLLTGSLKGIQEYAGKIQLGAPDGGCLLQHGVRLKPKHLGETVAPEYLVDIDAFRNEVQLSDTGDALKAIHAQAFDMFDWAIGPKARDYLLQNATPKNT